eukprot:7538424-Pyramimonas_sp.AAC.1
MTFVSKDVPFTTWSDPAKLISFDRFFGPGIWSSVYKVSGETGGPKNRQPEHRTPSEINITRCEIVCNAIRLCLACFNQARYVSRRGG